MSCITWCVSSQHAELGYSPHIPMLKTHLHTFSLCISKYIWLCVLLLLHYHFLLQVGFDVMTLAMRAHTTAMFFTNQKKKRVLVYIITIFHTKCPLESAKLIEKTSWELGSLTYWIKLTLLGDDNIVDCCVSSLLRRCRNCFLKAECLSWDELCISLSPEIINF